MVMISLINVHYLTQEQGFSIIYSVLEKENNITSMEQRINELEMLVSIMQEQIKQMQFDLSYMQKQIDDNCIWIKQEEHGKILA